MTKLLYFLGMAIITMMLCYLIAANFAPESVALANIQGAWEWAINALWAIVALAFIALVAVIAIIGAYARANETAYEQQRGQIADDARPQIVNHGTIHIHNHYHGAEPAMPAVERPGRSLTHG
jgi:membrane protein YdbS with pleckstrin-like domain